MNTCVWPLLLAVVGVLCPHTCAKWGIVHYIIEPPMAASRWTWIWGTLQPTTNVLKASLLMSWLWIEKESRYILKFGAEASKGWRQPSKSKWGSQQDKQVGSTGAWLGYGGSGGGWAGHLCLLCRGQSWPEHHKEDR